MSYNIYHQKGKIEVTLDKNIIAINIPMTNNSTQWYEAEQYNTIVEKW